MIPILKIQPGQFKGLDQSLDDNLLKWNVSPDCQNMDVSEGILSTCGGSTKLNSVAIANMTIKQLFKFELASSGHTLICGALDASNNAKWYYMKTTDKELYEIKTTPGGASLTTMDPRYTSAIQTDIGGDPHMILTDGSPPVKIWESGGAFYYDVLGGSPAQGYYVTSHRERLWLGKGGGSNPSTVYYSNAYDPEDWSTAEETGSIIIESNDGQSITTIQTIFDDVVIFKKSGMWIVTGDIPSEYSVEKLLATQGTLSCRGVHYDGNLCFYVGGDGIYQYNGNTGTPLLVNQIKDVFDSAFYRNIYTATVRVLNNKVYIFESGNTDCLVYDTLEKTIEKIVFPATVYAITTSERIAGGLLYYTDGEYIYYLDDTKKKFDTSNITAYWYVPESDLKYPNAIKTLTNIYFSGWGTTSADAAGGQVKFTIGYKPGNTWKTKEKTVTLQTGKTVEDIPLNLSGRLFYVKIENVDGSAINLAGLTFIFEVDED